MLIIRLLRIGKKNQPSFRLVLTEKTAPPRGKFLEVLGKYNPRSKEISLKEERIKYWLGQGVQTSETVHNLLVKQGVIKGPKRKKKVKEQKKQKKLGANLPNDLGDSLPNLDKSEEKSKIETK